MAYMLLVMEVAEERRNRPKDVGRAAMEKMGRFAESLQARGVLKMAESLRTAGVRVEAREGKRTVSDGPFTEAKELVGGIFLLDCRTREEALAIANECPATAWATVEVRELGPCYE